MKKVFCIIGLLLVLSLLGTDGGESNRVDWNWWSELSSLVAPVRETTRGLTVTVAGRACSPGTHWVSSGTSVYFDSGLGQLGGRISGSGGCQLITNQTSQAIGVRLDGGEAVWVARGSYQRPPPQAVVRLQPVAAVVPTPTPRAASPVRSEVNSVSSVRIVDLSNGVPMPHFYQSEIERMLLDCGYRGSPPAGH